MIKIDNLKEKELLIAHYFCGKLKKEFTPSELYDMWCNWFKKDFRINGKRVFQVEKNKLVYRSDVKKQDKKLLQKYDTCFKTFISGSNMH